MSSRDSTRSQFSRPSRRRGLLAITALLAGTAGQLPAQGIPLQPEGLLFGEIPAVTAASRFEQETHEAPASITVITAEEIARQGWRTLAEVLQSVRGFYTTYDRNYTYVGVRGFGRPGDYNSRVLLLLDGQRMNDNLFSSAYYGTESPVELGMVERVEVIRGPGSSLYGTAAFFGVVNVIMRRGHDFRGAELEAAGESHDGWHGRASVGTHARSGLEVVASASLYRRSGEDLYFAEFDDPATNFGRAVGLDDDRREHAYLKLARGPLTFFSNFANREKQVPTASFGTTFNDPAEQTTDRHLMAALQFAPTLGRRGRLASALSYNSYDYEGAYPYPGAFYTDYGRGRSWRAEVSYVHLAGPGHTLVLGGEYQWNTRLALGGRDETSGTTVFRHDSRADNWGLFAQGEMGLARQLLLNAGLRYDHYPAFGATLNPRAALIYHWGSGAAKLLAGRAFRAPTDYERFYADGVSTKSSPRLNPERIWTLEATLEQEITRRWHVEFSLYDSHLDHLITYTTDPVDGLYVYRNLDRAEAHGIELETEGQLGSVNLRASYGLQRARDGSGALLSNSPRHLGKVDFWREFYRGRLSLGSEWRVMSERTAANGSRVAGHAIANLTLRTQDWPRRISAGLSVNNLFDETYGDPGSEEHLQTLIPQDGRSVRLTAQYHF